MSELFSRKDKESVFERIKIIYDLIKEVKNVDDYIKMVETRMNKDYVGIKTAHSYEKTAVMCLTSIFYRCFLEGNVRYDLRNLINDYGEYNPEVFSLDSIPRTAEIITNIKHSVPGLILKDKEHYSAYWGNTLVYIGNDHKQAVDLLEDLFCIL